MSATARRDGPAAGEEITSCRDKAWQASGRDYIERLGLTLLEILLEAARAECAVSIHLHEIEVLRFLIGNRRQSDVHVFQPG